MDREQFRKAVAESRLPKAALARLYNVTRPTIYSWLDDGEPKNASLVAHADRVTKALLMAVSRRILPFPESVGPKSRAQHIERMHQALTHAK